MALENLRGYVDLANLLTAQPRRRIREAAQELLSNDGVEQAKAAVGPMGKQAQQIAEEFVESSKSNASLLVTLVRGEIDRAITGLGLPNREEIDRLERRISRLERAMAGKASATAGPSSPVGTPVAKPPARARRTPTVTPADLADVSTAAKISATRRAATAKSAPSKAVPTKAVPTKAVRTRATATRAEAAKVAASAAAASAAAPADLTVPRPSANSSATKKVASKLAAQRTTTSPSASPSARARDDDFAPPRQDAGGALPDPSAPPVLGDGMTE